jgi:hypothetical protein
MSNGKFFVVGGEYADTNFAEIANGQEEERFGPLHRERGPRRLARPDRQDRGQCAGALPDPARSRIDPRGWYVVGGEYADTHFLKLAPGQKLESYGPFPRPRRGRCGGP